MQEAIDDFYRAQFEAMPEVKESYDRLLGAERRIVNLGDLDIIVQHNPARVRSTAAKVNAEDIEARPCFLCRKNRPEKQLAGTAIPDFEILINPYPILPVHFTIVSKEHTPQKAMPLEMVDFVNMLPLCTAFFNGANAGASAPDHLHFQGVRCDEIPLLDKVSSLHTPDRGAILPSGSLGDFPMSFISVIIPPDFTGMQLLSVLPTFSGVSDDAAMRRGLVNTFLWKDASGLLRAIVIPRKAHRPACYFAEGEERMMVSPGALDMAGIIVTPRREDFERISAEDIRRIYAETGLTLDELTEYCKRPDIAQYIKKI